MKTLFPSASACVLVAFVASVSYAQSFEIVLEAKSSKEKAKASSTLKTSESGEAPQQLSVPPSDHKVYPPDRPAWVSNEPDFESDVHTWVVTTTAYETTERCEQELEELRRAAISMYISRQTGWICDEGTFNDDWIEELTGRRYVGGLLQGEQELREIAVELRFDRVAQEKIRSAFREAQLDERLRATGGFFALGLVGLCCTGGLLSLLSRRYA
ncbi:MAG: hypothetical protein AAFX06_27910 [Planctomycetota bacterium]